MSEYCEHCGSGSHVCTLNWIGQLEAKDARIASLEHKLAVATEALEFYAKISSWEWTTSEFTFDGCGCTDFDCIKRFGEGPVQVGGKRARAALEDIGGEK